MRLPDSHIHSKYSFDGKHTVSEMVREGLRKNPIAMTITDHCELTVDGSKACWSYSNMFFSKWDARKYARKAAGKMTVCAGIELGQPMHNPAQARRVLQMCRHDFVLASVHYLRDGRDFYYLNYKDGSSDPHEVYSKYLTELLETAQYADFDSLAHMTYPLRYIIGRDGIDFDESRYYDIYDKILAALVQRGRALEVNVSGYRRENGSLQPGLDTLIRFRELGGKYVTLGSDAHRLCDLAVGINEGAQLVREAGFDRVVYYVKRRPVEVML